VKEERQRRVTVTVPVSVTVSPSATIPAGGTQQLTAATYDANGNVLTGRTITWASSNAAVATVPASGLVTGVASDRRRSRRRARKSGTASIMVQGGSPFCP
jgi:uncharacterized protein YjdB